MKKPKIIVENDYDGYFKGFVKEAIARNIKLKREMIPVVRINSGSWRMYDVRWEREEDLSEVKLDFYAASRVFGGDYTVADIANMIAIKMR